MIYFESRPEKLDMNRRTVLTCPPHFHTELELVLMHRGHAIAQADSHSESLAAGDLFLSFPNQLHYFHDDSPDLEASLLIVPLSMCSDYKKLLCQNIPTVNRIPAQQVPPESAALIDGLFDAAGPYVDGVRKGLWLVLLGLLLPLLPLEPTGSNENDVLRKLLNYCMEHLGGDLSLDTVAKKVSVGKYYISHLFREKLGIGFHEYVNMLRVNEAAKQLREANDSVTEVAYAVGFSCVRTFNRAFQKQMLCSPREYRQNGGTAHGDRL